jgi:sarcosine oxidase
VLAADRCLDALRVAGSFRVRTDADVVTLVLTGGESHQADIVVNCAGHRALSLLADGDHSAVAAVPSLPQVAYFARHNPAASLPPVFIEWGPEMFYGLPVPDAGGPHAGTYKLSHHTPGPPFDHADDSPFRSDPGLLKGLVAAAGRLLPAVDPAPVATDRCVYDNSADTDFVLDRVGRVVVGCGTSGHAFKFGPLLGELLADLAEDRTPAVDLSRFSLVGRSSPPDAAASPRPR